MSRDKEQRLPDGAQPAGEIFDAGFSRRAFLKFVGLGGAAAAAGSTLLHAAVGSFALPGEEFPPYGPESRVASLCTMCAARCGMIVRKIGDRAVRVEGNPLDPANQGGLCPIAQASLQLAYNPDRVRGPLKLNGERGSGRWQSIGWPDALALIKSRLDQIRTADGPHTVAFLGDGTNELAGRLARRFLDAYGSPNFIVDCAAASSHGQDLTQGIDGRVAYDFENARYILSFGAPLFEAWMSPVRQMRGIGEFRAGWLGQRGKLVQIESRLSATAARADEWVPINPGTDGVLALGIAGILVRYRYHNAEFVNRFVAGFDQWPDARDAKSAGFKDLVLDGYDTARVAEITGVPSDKIIRLAHEFAHSSPALAVPAGTRPTGEPDLFATVAVQSLNALVGAIDRPGGVLVRRDPPLAEWSPVKQDDVARSGLARKPLEGVAGLARAAQRGDPYKLNALFVLGANPLYSSPLLRQEAIDRIPFVVSLTPLLNETAAHADLILPDCSPLEQYEIRSATPGFALTSVAVASPALLPRHRSRPASQVLLDLAHSSGGALAAGFPWQDAKAALDELLASLPAQAHGDVFSEEFHSQYLRPEMRAWEWPARKLKSAADFLGLLYARGGWVDPRYSFGAYAETLRRSGGKFVLPALLAGQAPESALYAIDQERYPFQLLMFQPLALTSESSANLPYLQEIAGSPHDWAWDSWAEINPKSAAALGIGAGDLIVIESPAGSFRTRARLFAGAMPGVINLPLGQGHTALGRFARDRGINPLDLTAHGGAPRVRLARA